MEAIKFKGCDDYLDIPFLLDRKKDLVMTTSVNTHSFRCGMRALN